MSHFRGPCENAYRIPRRAIAVLQRTFVHIDGVGYATERRLWHSGVDTWYDWGHRAYRARLPRHRARAIDAAIGASVERLRRGDAEYFARCLPLQDRWRTWKEFRNRAACLDIETTGTGLGRDAITVVGVHDGQRAHAFVRGINLERASAFLGRFRMLVTYNGARFDLPFLSRAWPRFRFEGLHLDLVGPLHRLGYYGGLKATERETGLERSDETRGLSGFDAVVLWDLHLRGDDDALDLLLAYNREDVAHLWPLADLAYRRLREIELSAPA